MIAVLVVDDQSLIRQAVATILDAQEDIEVIGQATNGQEALDIVAAQRAADHPVDVIVMDIRMPVMDGIEATRQLCAEDGSGARVLILTTFEEDEYVVSALRAGASGFVGKGAEPEEIAHAVRVVNQGDSLLSPKATKALISQYVQTPENSATQAPASPIAAEAKEKLSYLTEREREVLVLVGRGLTNQQIAEEIFISPHTAKTHVNRIMTKVHAHDRAQLVILAYESGLLNTERK